MLYTSFISEAWASSYIAENKLIVEALYQDVFVAIEFITPQRRVDGKSVQGKHCCDNFRGEYQVDTKCFCCWDKQNNLYLIAEKSVESVRTSDWDV